MSTESDVMALNRAMELLTEHRETLVELGIKHYNAPDRETAMYGVALAATLLGALCGRLMKDAHKPH